MTELSITRHGAQRMGFFTDTTVCIGCKACEVACKQWNDLPSDGGEFRKGGSYDNTGELGRRTRGATCASSSSTTATSLTGPRRTPDRQGLRPQRLRLLGLHVRRLQALHERRLHGRVPDGGADPHRVRLGRAPARRLQRLRLLHPVVPVRRRRPRSPRRPRRQVHALLRPARGRSGAGVREGLPDGLDPVRALRRARRRGRTPCRGAARARHRGRVPVRRRRSARDLARGWSRRVLPAHPAARALRAARNAESPIQEHVVPATLAAVGAGLLAAAGVAAAFVHAARKAR